MSLTPSEANQLRGLVGRRVNAAIVFHSVIGSGNVEAEVAADRDDTRTAKELAEYIDKLETR